MTSYSKDTLQTVSIVVPVYRGELTLERVLAEIDPLTTQQSSSDGISFRVCEVILVHDGAVDGSDRVISALADRMSFVTPIWLSRNLDPVAIRTGHAGESCRMASTNGDWV